MSVPYSLPFVAPAPHNQRQVHISLRSNAQPQLVMCIASWGSLHPAKSHHFTRLAGVALIAVSPVCHSSFARGLHCLSACLLAALSCRVPVSELPPRMADYPSSGGKHLIPQFQPLRRVVLITHQRICLVSVSGGLPDRAHNHRLHRTHTAATGKPQAVRLLCQ